MTDRPKSQVHVLSRAKGLNHDPPDIIDKTVEHRQSDHHQKARKITLLIFKKFFRFFRMVAATSARGWISTVTGEARCTADFANIRWSDKNSASSSKETFRRTRQRCWNPWARLFVCSNHSDDGKFVLRTFYKRGRERGGGETERETEREIRKRGGKE